MDQVDAVVIGAGVVGLAVARALTARGRDVLILEAADSFGTETSSRNSEVIHAGIYYPLGSLKARMCVSGRTLLYDFCEQYGIPYRRCGKLIVATSESQLTQLEKIQRVAHANGVRLEFLGRPEALELEAKLSCEGALHSPMTGIIDSHAYMLALLGQAESRGATLVTDSTVTRMELDKGGVLIGINNEEPLLRWLKRLLRYGSKGAWTMADNEWTGLLRLSRNEVDTRIGDVQAEIDDGLRLEYVLRLIDLVLAHAAKQRGKEN